jgi:phage terminase small subunit
VKLNPKQEKFCLEYASSGNATQAYQVAYGADAKTSSTNASKLLRNTSVKARLKELADEIASAKIADVRELQERLTKIIRGEVTEEVILPSGEIVQRQVTIRDILKAIEILAKIQGLFVVKQEVDIKNAPVIIGGAEFLED